MVPFFHSSFSFFFFQGLLFARMTPGWREISLPGPPTQCYFNSSTRFLSPLRWKGERGRKRKRHPRGHYWSPRIHRRARFAGVPRRKASQRSRNIVSRYTYQDQVGGGFDERSTMVAHRRGFRNAETEEKNASSSRSPGSRAEGTTFLHG